MDTHSYTTDICVKTRANGPGRKWHVATTIPAIREVIESWRLQAKTCRDEVIGVRV
jgi:hypothetical protein